MMLVLSLMTGVLGLYLNYRVLKEVDWSSPAYSLHRHFQFVLASVSAIVWTYCIVGVTYASLWVVAVMFIIVSVLIVLHKKHGCEKMCSVVRGVVKGFITKLQTIGIRKHS